MFSFCDYRAVILIERGAHDNTMNLWLKLAPTAASTRRKGSVSLAHMLWLKPTPSAVCTCRDVAVSQAQKAVAKARTKCRK